MSLHRYKSKAKGRIDQAAGDARVKYITEVPGQQAVYQIKREEALAYLAGVVNGAPTLTAGPHIAAEAAARGITALATAQIVADLAAVWTGTLSPAIEAARMGGKIAVDAAADEAGVDAAESAARSNLGAL